MQNRLVKDYISLTVFHEHTLKADNKPKVDGVSAEYTLV